VRQAVRWHRAASGGDTDTDNAHLLQVLLRQACQDLFVDFVLAESRLVLFEAEAPQPAPDVNSHALAGHGL